MTWIGNSPKLDRDLATLFLVKLKIEKISEGDAACIGCIGLMDPKKSRICTHTHTRTFKIF